jgi:hypothetical protein
MQPQKVVEIRVLLGLETLDDGFFELGGNDGVACQVDDGCSPAET